MYCVSTVFNIIRNKHQLLLCVTVQNISHINYAPLFFMLLCLLGYSVCGCRDDAKSREATNESNNTCPGVIFEEDVLSSVDVCLHSRFIKYIYTYQNISDQPVVIADAKTGCSCTSVNYTEIVEPGEKGEVVITYDPSRKGLGVYKEAAIIRFTHAMQRPVVLTAAGNVIESVAVRPSEVVFAHANLCDRPSQLLTLKNNTNSDIVIGDSASVNDFITIDPESCVILAGGTVSVNLAVKDSIPIGEFNDKIIFRTDSKKIGTMQVNVSGNCQFGPVYTIPSKLDFGVVTTSQSARGLTFVADQGFMIDDIKAEGLPVTVLALPDNDVRTQKVNVQLQVSKLPLGVLTGSLLVHYSSGGKTYEVTIPITVYKMDSGTVAKGLDGTLNVAELNEIALSEGTNSIDAARGLISEMGWTLMSEHGSNSGNSCTVVLESRDNNGKSIKFQITTTRTGIGLKVFVDKASMFQASELLTQWKNKITN